MGITTKTENEDTEKKKQQQQQQPNYNHRIEIGSRLQRRKRRAGTLQSTRDWLCV